mmetsp:Transcript_28011/g.47070  ORF Transcript_28011/g.47070 Transcript_28011/m.47070 type:complete len:506 (+) Transcript_28011:80-1597(+)
MSAFRSNEDDRQDESDIEDGNASPVPRELQPSDFFFGSTLGEGAYARVVHAKSKQTSEQFAVKIMEKVHIKRENKVKQVMKERQILTMLSHPFIVKFHFSFQDAEYLYMCIDLAPGGELQHLISMKQDEKLEQGIDEQACDYSTSQFYIAEIIEAIEYLHSMNIIHRDLKPDNVLLSETGHVKLTDFGTSTVVNESGDGSPRTSFVGTQDYVSPEVLTGEKNATKACDLWALGCMVFQILTGISPFREATEYLTFESIMGFCKGTKPLTFPKVIDATAQDLIHRLLKANDQERLGAGPVGSSNSYAALKAHAFFAPIRWGKLHEQTAPYRPDPSTFPSDKNMQDGALDDWLFEGDPTPIMGGGKDNHLNSGGGGDDDDDDDSRPVTMSKWEQFLIPGERRVFTGEVFKRKGLFSKKRQLILTDMPRLIYVDPDTMELKGEIPWTEQNPVSCVIKNTKEFDIQCSATGRNYHISDPSAGSQMWADLINAVLHHHSTGGGADGETKP